MTNLLTLLRRAGLWLAIYALEILIKGSTDTLAWLNDIAADVMLRTRVELARSGARRELARLRSEYNATLPVGQRRTWSMA